MQRLSKMKLKDKYFDSQQVFLTHIHQNLTTAVRPNSHQFRLAWGSKNHMN